MTAFCTTLDSAYLSRALALHRSLERHSDEFRLYVLCVDRQVASALETLDLHSVTTIALRDLERVDPELEAAKAGRSIPEYCWTAKPSLCRYLLDREPELDRVTYVDADLMFHADPRLLLGGLGSGSILLVPHRFPPEHPDWTRDDGIYNAGWISFANDERARAGLVWWRARCLEWCYNRREDGRYTDQKYLEGLAEQFDGVDAIQHPGGGLAPWNASQHSLAQGEQGPTVDGQPVVFYHYQSLKLLRPSPVNRLFGRVTGHLRLEQQRGFRALWWIDPYYGTSESEIDLLWRPYVRQVLDASETVRSVNPKLEVRWAALRDLDWRHAIAKAIKQPSRRAQ